jgi:hypothetical protein
MDVSRDRIKSIARIALLVALLVSGSSFSWNTWDAAAQEGSEPNIAFNWAFSAMVYDGSAARVEPIGADTVLKTGDHFKMLVELRKECYVYVVYHNAQDEVSVLFPYSLQQFTTDYAVSKKYYIPQGDAWFELDSHTGRETFYVLASIERLTDLEELLSWYQTADSVKKPEITKQILTQIRNIKTEHRDLAAPAERPVPIGGAIRGIERAQGANRMSVDSVAEEISATDFYAKTYTLDHQ